MRPVLAQRLEVGHLLASSRPDVARHGRAPAAALVVVDQLAAVGERVEAGQQVVVVGAGAAVQHDHRRARCRSAARRARPRGPAPSLGALPASRPCAGFKQDRQRVRHLPHLGLLVGGERVGHVAVHVDLAQDGGSRGG